MFNLLRLFLVITVCLSWQMVGATAPKVSVASSNTPKYTKGQVLTENTKIDLKKGDKLTLQVASSSVVYQQTFDGPYSESKLVKNQSDKKDGSGGIIKTITGIFGTDRKRAKGIVDSKFKDPWLLVVSEDNIFCYDPNIPLKFLRDTLQKKIEVVMTDMTNLTGLPKQDWDTKDDIFYLSVDKLSKILNKDTSEILVKFLGKKGEKYLANLYKIPEDGLISNTSKWVWMMDNKCERQADKLIPKKRVASQ